MIGVTIRRQCEDTEERREESGVREWRNVLTSERTPRIAHATRNQESGMEQILSRSLQREPATDISISDFWPWEPRGHTFLLPKPSSLWGFAVTALGEEHTTLPLCQSDWWPARLVTQDWVSHSSPLRDMHITQSGPVRISPGVFFCLFVCFWIFWKRESFSVRSVNTDLLEKIFVTTCRDPVKPMLRKAEQRDREKYVPGTITWLPRSSAAWTPQVFSVKGAKIPF